MLLVGSTRITHPTSSLVLHLRSAAAARPAPEVRHGLLPLKLAMADSASSWPSGRCGAPAPLELIAFDVVEAVEALPVPLPLGLAALSTSRASRRASLLFPATFWTWRRITWVATCPGLRW